VHEQTARSRSGPPADLQALIVEVQSSGLRSGSCATPGRDVQAPVAREVGLFPPQGSHSSRLDARAANARSAAGAVLQAAGLVNAGQNPIVAGVPVADWTQAGFCHRAPLAKGEVNHQRAKGSGRGSGKGGGETGAS